MQPNLINETSLCSIKLIGFIFMLHLLYEWDFDNKAAAKIFQQLLLVFYKFISMLCVVHDNHVLQWVWVVEAKAWTLQTP